MTSNNVVLPPRPMILPPRLQAPKLPSFNVPPPIIGGATSTLQPPTPLIQGKTIVPPIVRSSSLLPHVQPTIIRPPIIQPTIIQPTIIQSAPILPIRLNNSVNIPLSTRPSEILPDSSQPSLTQSLNLTRPSPRLIIHAPVVQTPTNTGGRLQQLNRGISSSSRSVSTTFSSPNLADIVNTPYKMLEKLAASVITTEQIQQLIALQYPDGSLIVNLVHTDILLEIVGMLRAEPYAEVLAFLRTANKPSDILWKQKALDAGREKVARELTIRQMEEKGVKGFGKCRKCGSTELVSARAQTRSLDEPATIFVRCVICSSKWKQ